MRYALRILAGVMVAAGVARGQTVRIMARASVNDGVVRLGNIATIEDATPAVRDRLAQTMIVEKLDGMKVVRAEEVLYAVLQQNQDLPLPSTLVIRGAAQCTVMPEGASPYTGPAVRTLMVSPGNVRANVPVSVGETPALAPAEVPAAAGTPPDKRRDAASALGTDATSAGSLAEQITQQVLKDFGSSPAEMDVKFATADPDLMGPVPAGLRWTFHATTGRSLGTMQWEAKLMKGNAPVKDLWVQATVRRSMVQAVTTRDLHAGDLLTADMVKVETVMADRQTPDVVADVTGMIGMEAQRPMAAGTPINRRDFVRTDAVAMDDVVTVYFVSGGIRVKSTAKALARGHLNESIKFQNDSKDVFEATVIGKRLAVVGRIDDATARELQEMK